MFHSNKKRSPGKPSRRQWRIDTAVAKDGAKSKRNGHRWYWGDSEKEPTSGSGEEKKQMGIIWKSGNATRHLAPRKRSNTFQICDRIYKSGNWRESETRDGGGASFQTKKSPGTTTPRKSPPSREDGSSTDANRHSAKKEKIHRNNGKCKQKDGQGNEVTKQPTHYTETDAERATRLASEMIARDFPETEKRRNDKAAKTCMAKNSRSSQGSRRPRPRKTKSKSPEKTMTQIRPNHHKKTNYENSKHSLRWR